MYCKTELFCKLRIFAIELFANIANSHVLSVSLYTCMTEAERTNCEIANIIRA